MMGDIPILLTELAETNLLDHIVGKNQEISEKSNLQILWQISRALEYVAENNMVHRDVAARNILMMKASVVKLADFGLCCKCDEETSTFQDSSHKRFPVKWLSPEVLINRIFSEKSDIWAFGVLCFEVFSGGQELYLNVLYYEMLDYLQDGYRLEKPSHASDAIYMLMLRCWDKEEIKRPKFKQISEEIRVMLSKENYGYLDLNEQKI
uniref:receptor protein-tyrosine kinase n=1 Tax=Panagrolaimus davidi TaxID=227884 RepID=A0A914Q3C8_9BILA